MNVLITGGAGFVGANLVRELLNSGHVPSVLDDFSTGLASNLTGLEVEIFEGSLEDQEIVAKAARGVDAIVHLGARGSVPRSLRNPVATHNVNVTGTLNVMEAARTYGAHVIFSSSSSVYGKNGELPKNEKMWTAPLTPYAASKLAAEGYIESYQSSYGVPVSIFRFFNVFGPWQRPDHVYAAVIPKWIWKAMNGIPIEVFGDGKQSRDFTFVETVTKIFVETINEVRTWSGPINLAYGRSMTLLDVVEELRAYFPELKVKFSEQRPGDVKHSQNNPTKLKSYFPEVDPVNFRDSFRETIQWMSNNEGKIIGGPQVSD